VHDEALKANKFFVFHVAVDGGMRLAAVATNDGAGGDAPLTAAERMQNTAPDGKSMRAYASRFIKPNDRLSSFERLEIYNRQYWFRLLSSMIEDFPVCARCVGDRKFEAMSRAYLVDCPSQSFTLRNLGARLETCFEKHPKWAGSKQNWRLILRDWNGQTLRRLMERGAAAAARESWRDCRRQSETEIANHT